MITRVLNGRNRSILLSLLEFLLVPYSLKYNSPDILYILKIQRYFFLHLRKNRVYSLEP